MASKKIKENGSKEVEINYLKKFKPIFSSFKKTMIVTFLIGSLIAVLGVLNPIIFQNIIDILAGGDRNNLVSKTALFLVGLGTLIIVLRILKNIQYNIINKSYHKMAHTLRTKLINSVTNTKISKFDKTSSGEILNRVDHNSNEFSAHFVNIVTYIPDVIESSIFIIYGLIVNVYLGLMFVLVGFFSFIIGVIGNKLVVLKYNRLANLIHDKKISLYNEVVRGIRDIRALNAKKMFLSRAEQVSISNYYASTKTASSHNGVVTLQVVANTITLVCALFLGIYFVSINAVSIGALLVLLMYRGQFANFFDYLADVITTKQSLNISAERMYEIFDNEKYPKEVYGNIELANPQGNIEFDNVNFSYGNEELLNGLNLKVNANECVGIVGKSGQGKSTIISLIANFYKANSGQVLLDGVNINDLTENSLCNMITLVSQMPYIFNLSIKDNLKIANEDATDEEIENACKKAYLYDFIQDLPNKYDTMVGEGGVVLSGGQRQRLAIARAFLKPTRILILDEATSALDNESQEKIKKAINELKNTCTIIIVAHRLTTVKDCDRILVLDKHKLVAEGSHTELMQTCEVYKNLYGKEEE